LPSEWEGPALAEEALCSKLADGNVRNFQARLIKAGEQERLPRLAWGCAPFSLIEFSHDLHPELATAVPRFCYV